ncbi:MAG: hypothetical protein JXA04_06885 [Gammaproteobacteria bacterium]|nr:hypothetical protein [Gammaproteobacteria bacterium]
MKKAIIGIIVLLVVILGAGIYYVSTHLDSLVKLAIESYGSEILKTDVRVRKVKIDLGKGSAGISDFVIGNPADFSLPSAFAVGKIVVDLDIGHSNADVIIIDKILIRAPEISYEINQNRDSNLVILQNNINSIASGEQSTTSGPQPSLIIRHFSLEQARLNALITPANNRKYDLTVPDIRLENLGGKNGASPAQISQQIFKALTKSVQAEMKRQGISAKYQQKIDAGKQKLESKADEKVEAKKSDLKNKLKGLL